MQTQNSDSRSYPCGEKKEASLVNFSQLRSSLLCFPPDLLCRCLRFHLLSHHVIDHVTAYTRNFPSIQGQANRRFHIFIFFHAIGDVFAPVSLLIARRNRACRYFAFPPDGSLDFLPFVLDDMGDGRRFEQAAQFSNRGAC